MMKVEIKMLGEEDLIFIETLKNLGISRNLAATMAYLMNVDEASSHEIEINTGLRQPEVNLAIKLMHNQSWISVRSENKPGRERPVKIYSLSVPVGEIISYYEDKISRASQATISVINKLKVMSRSMPFVPSR